ncbi:2-phospho-L-lactate guanylyltransferase [Nocardioides sp.]|uniref:2-phospho-L-lactate guanylyltransferase n=1 Tax=Nocardioides sp. TaxID=35761 RepID=UPI0037834168
MTVSTPSSDPPVRYVVLVPVKPPAVGKSRLHAVGAADRRALAEAFALDTVAACVAAATVAEVLVVTDDARFSTRLAGLGTAAIPDGVAGDLNGTLRQAAAEAHRRWPALRPVALCADLPALRPADLDAALAAAGPHPAFVPDAAGVGTTLYTATYEEFDPRFGVGSREAHLDAGAREILGAAASVRRDVDDLDDLRDAVALGVGPATAALT